MKGDGWMSASEEVAGHMTRAKFEDGSLMPEITEAGERNVQLSFKELSGSDGSRRHVEFTHDITNTTGPRLVQKVRFHNGRTLYSSRSPTAQYLTEEGTDETEQVHTVKGEKGEMTLSEQEISGWLAV